MGEVPGPEPAALLGILGQQHRELHLMLVRNWLLHENTTLTKEHIKTIINKELHR